MSSRWCAEQLEVSSSGKRLCSGDMNELRMWML